MAGTNPFLTDAMPAAISNAGQPAVNQGGGNTIASLLGAAGANAPGSSAPQLLQPPSHEEVAAALTHFHELGSILKELMGNPELGRKSIRPAIFDAAASLIGNGSLTIPEVMKEVQTLPENPIDQKKWVLGRARMIASATEALLSHFAAGGYQGAGSAEVDIAGSNFGKTKRRDAMKSLGSKYRG